MGLFYEHMLIEADQLSERLLRLDSFIDSDAFAALSALDQNLLNAQSGAMSAYLSILTLRIGAASNDLNREYEHHV